MQETQNTEIVETKKKRLQADALKTGIAKGPCYLKLTVDNMSAGSIIGKSGAVISGIEQESGCLMKLSSSNYYYPKTNERVLVMGGELDNINKAVSIILGKVQGVAAGGYADADSDVKITCKIVVPRSAVSMLIGRNGAQLKEFQESTQSRIQISSRDEGLPERVVTITGTYDQVKHATILVAANIQSDPNLSAHLNVVYPPSGSPMPLPGQPGFQHPQFGMPGFAPLTAYTNGAYTSPGSIAATMSNELLTTPVELEMHVPDSSVGVVIGKNGANITEIMNYSGAKLQLSGKTEFVPGTQNRRITISGPVPAVHACHLLLLQRLADSQTQGNRRQGGESHGHGSPHRPTSRNNNKGI